jgi:hypothetical protein
MLLRADITESLGIPGAVSPKARGLVRPSDSVATNGTAVCGSYHSAALITALLHSFHRSTRLIEGCRARNCCNIHAAHSCRDSVQNSPSTLTQLYVSIDCHTMLPGS